VPGGLDAVLAAAANPALASFARQSFSSHQYYDAMPLSLLIHTAARVRGISLAQWAREAAADYATSTMNGMAGLFLKSLSVETLATWLPRVSAWFNDFGSIESRATGPRIVRVTRTGLPTFMVLGWAIAGVEFVDAALRHNGAKGVRIYPLSVDDVGSHAGIGLHRVAFELTWNE
jgi:hypothetical protein